MKLILIKNFKTLGNVGDVINVANGYGRNYLIPYKFAIKWNSKEEARILNIRKKELEFIKKAKEFIVDLEQTLSASIIKIPAKASESNILFGSIHKDDIINAIEKLNIKNLNKEDFNIELENINSIKSLGIYNVKFIYKYDINFMFNIEIVNDNS